MKDRIIAGSLLFKGVERFSAKFIGLVVSIFLARLLTPEDFGQVAIITVFVNLCQVFVDSGLNSALVQNKTADKTDYSTVFYISFGVAIVLSLGLILAAPFIGAYYQSTEIVLPLRVYSLSLLVAAYHSVQTAKLQREMKFKTVLYTGLIATVISGAIGVALAALGAGIWALVIHYFAYTVASCIAVFIVDRWYPVLAFSLNRAKELFSYGWKMLVSGLLCSLYADIRTLIIGKMFSTSDLGYYNRGQQFPVIVSGTAEATINSVIFPAAAERQDDREAVKALIKKTLKLGSLFIIPIMVMLSMAAESIIVFFFTEKWLPAVPFMRIIAIGSANIAIVCAGLTSIKSIGRSDVYMRLEMVRRVSMLIVLLVSVFGFKSVEAIAWGYAISAWIDVVIISIPTKKLVGYGIFEQISDVWRIVLASALMGGVVFLVGLISAHVFVVLALQCIAGILSYGVFCYLLKIDSFMELVNYTLQKTTKKD